MINYKKYMSVLAVLLMIINVAACAPEEKKGNNKTSMVNLETNQNSESGGTMESILKNTPSHINKVFNENYIVDAEVHVPDVSKADVLSAKYKKFDEQTLLSVCFNKKKPNKETDSEGVTSFKGEDSGMIIMNNTIHYWTDNSQYIKYPTDSFIAKSENIVSVGKIYDEVYKKDKLSFMTREKAIETAYEFLKKLSIDNIDHAVENTEIYPIDFKTMQKVQEEQIKQDKDYQRSMGISTIQDPTEGYKIKNKFTKEDEFYNIYFKIKQNGIPVTQMGYSLNETRDLCGSTVRVLLSKKGIIEFTCEGIYEIKKIAESPNTLLSAEQAAQKAYEIYDSVISTDKVTIKTIDFEYIPIAYNDNYNEVKLTPAWSMFFTKVSSEKKENEKKDSESNGVLYINAITGKQIK